MNIQKFTYYIEIKNRKQLECEMKTKGEENTLLQKNLKELEFELNSTKENIKVLKENENLLQKENEDRAIRINELLIKYSSLKSEYEEYKLDNIMYASIFVLFLINLFIKYRNKEDIKNEVFKYRIRLCPVPPSSSPPVNLEESWSLNF